MRRLGLRSTLRDYTLITIGSLILAVNLNLFLAPGQIAPGGVSGSAIIINGLFGLPIGMTMLVLNIPLIILGYRILGTNRFLIRTLYAVLLYSLGSDIIKMWTPAAGITGDLLLNALFGGIVGGIGCGLIFRGEGTPAGSGILSRVLQLRTGIPVSQLYVLIDGVVILIASLVFGWERGLYALICVFVWGLATDYVLEGPSVVRLVFVVTDSPETVTKAIWGKLQLGVTGWPAEGMYTTEGHTVLFTTVSRPFERALREAIHAADPGTFVVAGQGHRAVGGMYGQPRPLPAGRRD